MRGKGLATALGTDLSSGTPGPQSVSHPNLACLLPGYCISAKVGCRDGSLCHLVGDKLLSLLWVQKAVFPPDIWLWIWFVIAAPSSLPLLGTGLCAGGGYDFQGATESQMLAQELGQYLSSSLGSRLPALLWSKRKMF